MSCFMLARAIEARFDGPPTGNLFGSPLRTSGDASALKARTHLLGGAMAGFTKSLAREWAALPVRVVDIDEIDSLDPFVVLTTGLTVDDEVEIGLSGDKLLHAVLESAGEGTPVLRLNKDTLAFDGRRSRHHGPHRSSLG